MYLKDLHSCPSGLFCDLISDRLHSRGCAVGRVEVQECDPVGVGGWWTELDHAFCHVATWYPRALHSIDPSEGVAFRALTRALFATADTRVQVHAGVQVECLPRV